MAISQQTATFTREKFDTFIKNLPYPPNRFQLPVLESVAFGQGNIIIDAKAGSGKTSLLKMIASLLKAMGVNPSNVLFQAFNKMIEIELNRELPKGFKAKTSHSLGFAMCREYARDRKIKLGKISDYKYSQIALEIAEKIHPDDDEKDLRWKAKRRIQSLISKVMANDTNPNDFEAVLDIADHYNIEDITPAILKNIPYAINEAVRLFKDEGQMGFIDMIYMPVKLGLQPKNKFRYVLVDEAQDLNSLQQEICEKHLAPDGRVIIVGDPKQSLYGFAGADVNSFWNLQERFNAEKRELNICYRCPTSHIAMAQNLVPTIEAAPSAGEGVVEYKHLLTDLSKEMNPGSMVISRLNAPLLSAYFDLIVAEKPSVILGRSIGKGLVQIVDRVAEEKGFMYHNMGKHLKDYFKHEKARLEQRPNTESKIQELSDSIDALQTCATNFDVYDVETFKEKLLALFVDAGDRNYTPDEVVTLCTVHKAKGLEADHIGIIYQRPKATGGGVEWNNIMPLSWEKQREWEAKQEVNIMYVAYTRSKSKLTIFGGFAEDETPDITDISNLNVDMFGLLDNADTFFEEEVATEPVSSIEEYEPAHVDIAHAHALLINIANLLSESLSLDGDERQAKLDEALDEANRHEEWRHEQKFTREKAQELVGDNWATLKDQPVNQIVRTAATEQKKQDEATRYALKQVTRVLNALSKSDDATTEEPDEETTDAMFTPVDVAGDDAENGDVPIPLKSDDEDTRYEIAFEKEVGNVLELEARANFDEENEVTNYLQSLSDKTLPYQYIVKELGETDELGLREILNFTRGDEWLDQYAPKEKTESPIGESDDSEETPEYILDTKAGYDSDTANAEVKSAEAAGYLPPAPSQPVEWAKWVIENAFDSNGNPNIVILDTETTDLPKNRDNFEIVQLSIIDVKGNTLYNSYIKPRVAKISSGAAAIHGIDDAKIPATAGYIGMELSKFEHFIKGKHVIAYNSPFDKDALENSFRLSKRTLPDIKQWHCAMRKYASHNPDKITRGKPGGWWKLVEALEQEGIAPDENAHDALADVQMTRQLIEAMAGVTNKSGPEIETQDEPASFFNDEETTETVTGDSEKSSDVEPVTEDDTPTPDLKEIDPYRRIADLFRKFSLEEAETFKELLDEVIAEKKAELEPESV